MSNNLLIRHLTRFVYSSSIQENTMVVCLQPLNDDLQTCHNFKLDIRPQTNWHEFNDAWGNTFHAFDIPHPHTRLEVTAEAKVEVKDVEPLADSIPHSAWQRIDEVGPEEFWHFINESHFVQFTESLTAFSSGMGFSRAADPLTTLRELNTTIYQSFTYDQDQTKADSPIDVALQARGGVCQDFSHIMLAIMRQLKIPARYVSGYLVRNFDANSDEQSDEAQSHAWVEGWLPDLGWIGFDPTNNLVVEDRHVRVAVGRDYADVPPTRGVFIGDAETELTVGVYIGETKEAAPQSAELLPMLEWEDAPQRSADSQWQAQQQQQQQ